MPLAALLDRLTGVGRGWPNLPTADYYLLGGIADLVGAHGKATADRPVVRLGPNTWSHEDRLVIVRYATADEQALIARRRWHSVHYVIDDLIPAAAASAELPPDYRARLGRFAHEILPRILALGPVIVAPSPQIRACFPQLTQRHLDPCCLAVADGHALPAPTPWQGPLRIAFLGTRSHAGSLPLLSELAAHLARTLPAAELHLFFGRHLPEAIARQANIVNHKPVPWSAYQAFCRAHPFHVGLAPVQDSAFARARSITKVMDHAAVGAVGLYARRAPFQDVVTHDVDGVLVGDTPEDWSAAILRLAAAPEQAMRMAAAGARLARDRGDPGHVRRFWLEALAIRPPA